MATFDTLYKESSDSSPIAPLRSTTLPSSDVGTDQPFSGGTGTARFAPAEAGATGGGREEWEWDTQPAEYEFGMLRLQQQMGQHRVAGPAPVRERILQSMGGVGGSVMIDQTKKYEELEQRKWERQMDVLRKRMSQLGERQAGQFPVSDLM